MNRLKAIWWLKVIVWLGIVHTFTPSPQQAEASWPWWVRGHPGLYSEPLISKGRGGRKNGYLNFSTNNVFKLKTMKRQSKVKAVVENERNLRRNIYKQYKIVTVFLVWDCWGWAKVKEVWRKFRLLELGTDVARRQSRGLPCTRPRVPGSAWAPPPFSIPGISQDSSICTHHHFWWSLFLEDPSISQAFGLGYEKT